MKKLLGTTILLAMIALLNMEQSANAAFFGTQDEYTKNTLARVTNPVLSNTICVGINRR